MKDYYSKKENIKKDIEHLVLKRFTTFEDLKKKVNEIICFYNLEVKDYGFKSDYDNDFEDFVVCMTIGNDDNDIYEEQYDIDLYFAITRIGERIIIESSFEEV